MYYTDCYIFGGCENVILNLFLNREISSVFESIFSYRTHKVYRDVLHSRVPKGIQTHPLTILSNESLWHKIEASRVSNLRKTLWKLPFALANKSGFYAFFNLMRLFLWFRKIRPDILHINNGGYPGAASCRLAVVSAKLARVPKIIFHVHNQATKPDNKFDGVLDRFIGKSVDYFVSASLKATKTLTENRPFSNEKVIQVYNFVAEDLSIRPRKEIREEFGIPDGALLIVEVAFLTERKGQRQLLQALVSIKKINPDLFSRIRIIFVGEGEDRSKIEDFIRSNHLDEKVSLTGFRNDHSDFINAAEIFVLPSTKNEDMPLVILDAMRLGKPIVASAVAGIAEEIRHGQEGILIAPGDTSELAGALVQLGLSIDLRERYGILAKNRYKEVFSKRIAMKRFLDIYRGLAPSIAGKELHAQ